MLNKERNEQLHDDIYGLLDTELFASINIRDSRRFSPSIDIHAEDNVDEDEVIIAITDVLQKINPEFQFPEIKNIGPCSGGTLFTTNYWCKDFSISIYFIRRFAAEAI